MPMPFSLTTLAFTRRLIEDIEIVYRGRHVYSGGTTAQILLCWEWMQEFAHIVPVTNTQHVKDTRLWQQQFPKDDNAQ